MRRVKRAESVMSLEDAFNEFILAKEAKGLSYDTIRNYKLSYSIFIRNTGHINCQEVTEHQIWAFLDTLRGSVSITSINHYLRDIRAFLRFCMAQGYMDEFEITLMKNQEEVPKDFSVEDIKRLLTRPSRTDDYAYWRCWAMVNYIYATGNRIKSVCSVKIGDIDFKRKEISISVTKNKRAQIIPLSNALETVLKEFIKTWRSGCSSDEYLFCNYSGYQLTTGAARQSFVRYCDYRGVSQHNLHGLRHSFAKGAIQNGMNVYALQSVLGHSSLEMTKKYVRLYSDDLKEDYSSYSPLDTIKISKNKGVNFNCAK